MAYPGRKEGEVCARQEAPRKIMMAGWEANMETGESRSYSPNRCHFRKIHWLFQAGVENIALQLQPPSAGITNVTTCRPVSP